MSLAFNELLKIVAQLRGEKGCPWDQAQTLQSLVPKVVEEAQELHEAVQKNDNENIEEELGDVLFTLLMMAQIAQEEDKFDIQSAMEKVGKKFIARHTWVFGKDMARTPEEALALWMRNKGKEKAERLNRSQKKT